MRTLAVFQVGRRGTMILIMKARPASVLLRLLLRIMLLVIKAIIPCSRGLLWVSRISHSLRCMAVSGPLTRYELFQYPSPHKVVLTLSKLSLACLSGTPTFLPTVAETSDYLEYTRDCSSTGRSCWLRGRISGWTLPSKALYIDGLIL